jgi:hypothetical protein
MIEKRKFAKAMFLCSLLVIIAFNLFWAEVTHAQQVNTDQSVSANDDISISYTNSSFTIESVSQYGNFSFTFEWRWPGGYITYNGSRRQLKELERISFTDKTAKYRMEYWVPITLLEYVDVDGNNLLNDVNDMVNIFPDVLIAGYKIFESIGVTNITTREDASGIPICEWNFTQVAMPMAGNITGHCERFPVLKENFHYYPLNGTLKMDIILQNYRNPANEFFKPENASSRFFISYGVRYVSLEQGNATVTVAFDGQELPYYPIDKDQNQTSKVYPTTSNVVVFKVNGEKRGFFDFGGKINIDDTPDLHVNGSVGPIRSYWYFYQTGGEWLEIGLNYPHVNQTLVHDPYFGLYSSARLKPVAIAFPFEWTVATAVISAIICTVAIVDYFRTKSRYLKPTIRPFTQTLKRI